MSDEYGRVMLNPKVVLVTLAPAANMRSPRVFPKLYKSPLGVATGGYPEWNTKYVKNGMCFEGIRHSSSKVQD